MFLNILNMHILNYDSDHFSTYRLWAFNSVGYILFHLPVMVACFLVCLGQYFEAFLHRENVCLHHRP